LNTYGYVGGNPLNEYDKYGLESVIGGGWTGLDTDWGAGPGALSFGLGVNYQYGPFGTASNVTVGFDSDGKLCSQLTICGSYQGFGLFWGTGIFASGKKGVFCEGESNSGGPYIEGGSVIPGASFSFLNDKDGNDSVATGAAGVGVGAAVGYQHCKTITKCLK
jgi:hypothetical protein